MHKLVMTGILLVLIATVLLIALYKVDINDLDSCSVDSDCVLVPRNYCGDIAAINTKHQWLWEKHGALIERMTPATMCKVVLPASAYHPSCTQRRCTALRNI